MGFCSNFLKGQDGLGSGVALNYRGSAQFGTMLGGCVSLFASMFFGVFVIVQLFTWIFDPNYDQQVALSYLGGGADAYDIPTSTFLPTFSICDNFNESGATEETYTFNDSTLWDAKFYQADEDGNLSPIEAVNCKTLI